MNYDDQRVERLKQRAAPDDDAADTELARLWFQFLADQGVEVDDSSVRYWRELDADRGADR